MDPSLDFSEEQMYDAYIAALPHLGRSLNDGFYWWIDQNELGSKRVQLRLNNSTRFSVTQHYMDGLPHNPEITAYYTIDEALVILEIGTNFSGPEDPELACSLSLTSAPLDEDATSETEHEYELYWYSYELNIPKSAIPAVAAHVLFDVARSYIDTERTDDMFNDIRDTFMTEVPDFTQDSIIWARDYQMSIPRV
ncbi:hypothetical protein HY469_01530 [Candidatus Roizmanbacteria bacterium]|nr:hypothetical protein [Candidatus Roizmanbacteria bacterium]